MGFLDQIYSVTRSTLGGSAQAPAATPTPSSAFEAVRGVTRSDIGSIDVRSAISAAAQRHGVPEDLLHNIAGAESSFNPKAGNKTGSSAKGLFQAIDSTWKGMGYKPGEQFDAEKNSDFGARYTKQNIETLRNKLRRDPSYGEVYAAHHFGSGVAQMIDRVNPNAPIESGLATFNNKEQVRRIMQQNPALRGKTVGDVMQNLHQKAGNKFIGSGQRAEVNIGDDEMGAQPTQVAQADDSYEDAWLEDDQQQLA